MVLAAFGIATMWEAIFADVGVALIAIGNAIRIQSRFSERGTLRSFFMTSENEPEESHHQACC